MASAVVRLQATKSSLKHNVCSHRWPINTVSWPDNSGAEAADGPIRWAPDWTPPGARFTLSTDCFICDHRRAPHLAHLVQRPPQWLARFHLPVLLQRERRGDKTIELLLLPLLFD